MDEYIFDKCLRGFEFVPEETKYLEILHFQVSSMLPVWNQ